MSQKKIIYVSGTRADYGLMKSVLKRIKNSKYLSLDFFVTGMHLMEKFGNTHKIVEGAFKAEKIGVVFDNSKDSYANFYAALTEKLHEVFTRYDDKSTILLVLGDRIEMFCAAAVATTFDIPIAHIHGGEYSSTIDNTLRQAITRLAHIHFASNKFAAERLRRSGEDKSRIFLSGAPGLDLIKEQKNGINPKEIYRKYKVSKEKKIFIVLQHPVTEEVSDSKAQMKNTLNALPDDGSQIVIIYPNADPGHSSIISDIEKFSEENCNVTVFKNIPYEEFLSLMSISDVLIGNSSSGIIESASFKLPTVNIGTRQDGRDRNLNVIDSGYETAEIKKAIKKSLDPAFLDKIKKIENIYGDGKASERIVKTLEEIKIGDRFTQKKFNIPI